MARPPRPFTMTQIRLEMARITRELRLIVYALEDGIIIPPQERLTRGRAIIARLERLIDRIPPDR